MVGRIPVRTALWLALGGAALGCKSKPEAQPPGPMICVVDGVTHKVSDTWRANDECNSCRCDEQGQARCTSLDCKRGVCVSDGILHQVGDTWPAGDGCNTCSCDETRRAACTAMGCPHSPPKPSSLPPPDVTCVVGGVTHRGGDSWQASDGFTTCRCSERGIVVCGTRTMSVHRAPW
jgi:hypothetical protein